MQITRFFKRNSVFLVLFLAAGPVWSYSGGGGGGAGYVPKCVPPKFKNLKPEKNYCAGWPNIFHCVIQYASGFDQTRV